MIDINKIYNENCLNTMKKMNDNFIDFVVTSPPYDDIRTYNGYSFDFESVAKELHRVIKDGGVMVWVVNDSIKNYSESGTSFKQALYFKEIGFNLLDTMIWLKNSFQFPSNTTYHQVFEYMFVLSKGKPKTFNPLLDRKNKTNIKNVSTQRQKDGTLKRVNKNLTLNEYGKRFNVWEIATQSGGVHPAKFPDKLCEDHIKSWSNVGDLVYDPFMGSGTTACMSIKNKRNYIGSEMSIEYCNLIEQNINKILNGTLISLL